MTPQEKSARRYAALGEALSAGDMQTASYVYQQLGAALAELTRTHTVAWTPPDRSAQFDAYLATEGTTLDLVLDRDIDAVDRDGMGVSFSEAALEHAAWQTTAWLGSRVMRAAEVGVLPQQAKITITVALDTELITDNHPHG